MSHQLRQGRMSPADRQRFGAVFDAVFKALPPPLRQLLDAVPVCVDDRPAPSLLQELGMGPDDVLLGLYTGTPLTEREYELVGEPSELIMLFREPLLAAACGADGRIDEAELAEQIRITLLHELGHHYGLDEDRLDELGYG